MKFDTTKKRARN